MPTRLPIPALRPFIETIWVSDHPAAVDSIAPYREYALPSGKMHLVLRLSDQPIRLIDDAHPSGHSYGHAVIGGARSSYYLRDIAAPFYSLGASLLPGAAEILFNVSASELAERHTCLDDVWGHQAISLRERLLEAKTAERQLDLFESFLVRRLPTIKGMHPAVAQTLLQLKTTTDVRTLVAQSGYSHRRFVELFRRTMGLSPKLYCRIQRFQNTLKLISADRAGEWAHIALASGYSDQSHFNREFREFAGMTPAEYRRIAPLSPSHVRSYR